MDFPNNSNKFHMNAVSSLDQKPQETPPKAKKVVTGAVQVKPKSEARKIADIFVADEVHNVTNRVIDEVLIPGIRDMIRTMITEAADMMFGGGWKRNDGRPSYSTYGSYYRYGDANSKRDTPPFRSRRDFDIGDIVLSTRADAEDVLQEMDDWVARYGTITVASLYDILGMDMSNYQANRYGWHSLRDADVQRVSGGYLLRLPRPELLRD